ncbi:uncharacterized protein LOC134552797 isoform X2 [Prinia subflava]|uniref:uncharacterized protein LOC134552797 isoform X2 n=1 Tax=Prinia subflava TaxID=208062 RepID=UPI002FE17E0C
MALADPLRLGHGPYASSCPGIHRTARGTERARSSVRLGSAGHWVPPGTPRHFSLCPKTRLSRPGERPGAAAALGGRAAPRGRRPSGPPAGDRRGRAPGKAPPERPRRPHRCAAGAADSGGPRPRLPPAAQRVSQAPRREPPRRVLLPLPRNCGVPETQLPPPPAWLRLPRHHLAASGSALLSAPGNFSPPAPPSRSRQSAAPALPLPSHLRSAGGAERAAVPSAPAAPGVTSNCCEHALMTQEYHQAPRGLSPETEEVANN